MNPNPALLEQLRFLTRVVRRESLHLAATDSRLFDEPFTREKAARLDAAPDLAERVEAFVGRFGRLQDTLGDKLLPLLLTAPGEKTSSAIDNLDQAERLGLVRSADEWMTVRSLRNQMVHEYIEDPAILAEALQAGHDFLPSLIGTATKMIAEIEKRGFG